MTVSSAITRADYAGNNVTTLFTVPFYFLDNSHVKVIRTDKSTTPPTTATLVLNSDYVLTGAGVQIGGQVQATVAPTATQTLTVLRNVPFTQLIHYVPNDPFPAATHEQALDQLTMEVQQLGEQVMHSLQFPTYEPTPATLSPASVRANTFLGFDTGGNLTYAPVPAAVGAGILTSEGPFIAGATFTPGTTTTLQLSKPYINSANVQVHFDGVYQGPDQYSISGTQIVFNSPIPVSVGTVYIIGGTSLSVYVPTSDSVAPVGTKLYNRINDVVSVKDFGALGDGAHDDTANITAAINSVKNVIGGAVYFPPGNYLCRPLTLTGFSSVKLFGAGRQASKISLTAPGILWTLSNWQFCTILDLTFQSFGANQGLAGGVGVQFDTASGNNHVERCNFFGFQFDGLRTVGTLGVQLSGHKVINCFFLGNGHSQLYFLYSNDFHIENNQYGIFNGLPQHAQKGCYLQNSSAGLYKGNLHWSNTVGLYDLGGLYNTYSLNRFEMSDQQNVVLDGVAYGVFTSNKVHTGSMGSLGTYDGVQLINSSNNTLLTDNTLFTFSAATGLTRYGINVDSGCQNITLGKNRVQLASVNSSFGPYRIDGGNGTDWNTNYDFDLSTSSGSTVAAGTTTFLGSTGANANEAATYWMVPRNCVAMRLFAVASAAPGVGQSFTYTVRVNGAAVATVATITGALLVADCPTTAPNVLIPANAAVSVQLTTSAGAPVAYHRVSLSFSEY